MTVETLLPKLFTQLVNRITQPIRANSEFEQSSRDKVGGDDGLSSQDPFFFVTDVRKSLSPPPPPPPPPHHLAGASLRTSTFAYAPSEGDGNDVDTGNTDDDAKKKEQRLDQSETKKQRVVKRFPRFKCVQAPVTRDTLLYWIMVASDPEAELACTTRGLSDAHVVDAYTQRFKARVFERIAVREDFLRDVYIDVEGRRQHYEYGDRRNSVDSVDTTPPVKGKGSTAERRRRAAVAEESLRALKAGDFDDVLHALVLEYVLRETGTDIDVFDAFDEDALLANEKEHECTSRGRIYIRLIKNRAGSSEKKRKKRDEQKGDEEKKKNEGRGTMRKTTFSRVVEL